MDRGAWRATVCVVAQSRARLSTQHGGLCPSPCLHLKEGHGPSVSPLP